MGKTIKRSSLIAYSFLLIISKSSAQEYHYFDFYFQTRVPSPTNNYRQYDNLDSIYVVMDFVDDQLVQIGKFYGFDSSQEVDKFFVQYEQNNLPYYNQLDLRNTKRAEILVKYESGEDKLFKTYCQDQVLYSAAWDRNGNSLLVEGSGNMVYSDETNKISTMVFKDSVLMQDYFIRLDKKDTIFNLVDTHAIPEKGMEHFYKSVLKKMKNAKVSREKLGLIYLEFVIDETGFMTDLNPLTELKPTTKMSLIKSLSTLERWIPAKFQGNPVKTQFILPITFVF